MKYNFDELIDRSHNRSSKYASATAGSLTRP